MKHFHAFNAACIESLGQIDIRRGTLLFRRPPRFGLAGSCPRTGARRRRASVWNQTRGRLLSRPLSAASRCRTAPGSPAGLLSLHRQRALARGFLARRRRSAQALDRFRDAFSLDSFEMRVLMIAMAPELDLRYERLYAFLQDDVSRRRPSVDLALNLLCRSPSEKLSRRRHFRPDAPLLRENLLCLAPDPGQTRPPLLAHALKLDDHALQLLLGEDGLDARLAPFAELVEAGESFDDLPLPDAVRGMLEGSLAHEAARPGQAENAGVFSGVAGPRTAAGGCGRCGSRRAPPALRPHRSSTRPRRELRKRPPGPLSDREAPELRAVFRWRR